jgi:predicted Zn-ribbon and HTH transcriptional regulator
VSGSRGLREMLGRVFGHYALRCRRCGHRFKARIWRASALTYARCPRCYSMELSTWSERFYSPPLLLRVRLRLGARPYRCDSCRCKFASFRPKAKFGSLAG